MSERMKDMDIGHALGVMMSACEFPPSGPEHVDARRAHLKALHDELDRARASEEQKDTVIKALADAAEEMNGAIILLIDGDARAVDAIAQSAGRLTEALRLAGRL